MTALLRSAPASTPAMRAVFGDVATLRAALSFEAALAMAEAEAGLLPVALAERIAACCDALALDPAVLAEEAAHAGTLAIPLVTRLRATLAGTDPDAARAVHRGATSQDLADTVLAMQVRDALVLFRHDLARIEAALFPLAHAHAGTPAMGRTLLQGALPIGWGLRVAHWAAGIRDANARLGDAAALPLQFGGAAGTRAGLEGRGAVAAAALARRLGLRDAPPWHARRDHVAALAAAVGIAIGMLGKMARDVSLLAQNELGEAREPTEAGRGGSSAMPHKRNPTGCQIALSAALRAPGLVASILGGLPQELERGLGGWQAEAPVLADLFLLGSAAAAAMARVAEGMEIDRDAMARSVETHPDPEIGESVLLVDALLPARGA